MEVGVPKGMRDFLPAQVIKRFELIEKIKRVFESFGFDPVETPAIEYWSVLSGKYGEETERLIYRFTDRGGREVGLRYDLTVPLARLIAMYPEIVKPFKRYQIQPVWRAEKPQKGRFREFIQCDIDIVGSSDLLSDAEVIGVIFHAFKSIGLTEIVFKIGHRELVRGILRKSRLPLKYEYKVAQSVDKLDKLGLEGVKEELLRKGFDSGAIESIIENVSLKGNDGVFFELLKRNFQHDESCLRAIEDVEVLFSYLESMGIPREFLEVDLSLVRGLDYYTGIVFEVIYREKIVGSIAGGGRYDNLIGLFSGKRIPACGGSVGIDRVITIYEEKNLMKGKSTQSQIFILRMDKKFDHEYLKIAQSLREWGFNVDFYVDEKDIRGQLGYAKSKGIPLVIIIGEREFQKGTLKLRDMARRIEMEINRENLRENIEKILSNY